MVRIINFLKNSVIFFVRIYQVFLSQLLGHGKCRFTPTCSNYMIEAIKKKGLIKGFAIGFLRILKCHPLSKRSGFDPVD